MNNDTELTKQDLETIAVVLRTIATINVFSDCSIETYENINLRSIADRAIWTLVNGKQFKE